MRASSDPTLVDAATRSGEAADTEAARVYLERARAIVDARLDALVPAATIAPVAVHAAMRWSLFAGGKRLRPALVLATGEAFGAPAELLVNTACAFELVHTYSLVHDDLPSMDDDDLRRGRPTCHVRFGEATAILAGDAMQALAFQCIAEDDALAADVRVRLVAELARAAGTPGGMVAGQAHDLSAESREDVSAAELDLIHRHKTGALIVAAARAGALVAGASESELRTVGDYAAALGLLFQITDDLLDVTATAEALGKTPGKDARAQKATYPALHGLEAARLRARAVYEQALDALYAGGHSAPLLRSIARLILERRA
ncbi:MAG: geranylgeranyl diphosphate synthase, type [Pyrinomonadaceae bacterium]|nr:geranylgeranyl diphosphate synthase, type [Pyrinomonadaceae bacterium]